MRLYEGDKKREKNNPWEIDCFFLTKDQVFVITTYKIHYLKLCKPLVYVFLPMVYGRILLIVIKWK
jgi:hypothetical protein